MAREETGNSVMNRSRGKNFDFLFDLSSSNNSLDNCESSIVLKWKTRDGDSADLFIRSIISTKEA